MKAKEKAKDPRRNIQLNSVTHFLAVGGGSGLVSFAPGTWGTLAGIIIGAFLATYLSASFFVLVILLSFWIGCFLCKKTTEDMGVHDHGAIVWDEFVGMWITLLAVPSLTFGWLVAAFLAFRFFDIVKPYPIKCFDQKLKSGFGIMFDDVLAAVYACIALAILRYIVA